MDDAQQWENVCDAVVDICGANGAILLPTNPAFRGNWMSCSTGLKKALPEYFEGGLHLCDPRKKMTELMLNFGHSTDDDVFPDRAAKAEVPFYKELLYRHDFGVLAAVRILTPNGYWSLMLHFANDHPPISRVDVALIGEVRSRLEAAALQAERTAHKRIADFASFFSDTESNVYVLDVNGLNCLSIGTGEKNNAPKAAPAVLPIDLSGELANQLKEIVIGDAGASISKSYQLNEQNVLVVQIPPSLRHYFMPFHMCAIVTDCEKSVASKKRRLKEEFELSESEVFTVDLLSSGKTPIMIADLVSLKPSSIRQRLKTIYEKTNVKSQVELIALYSQL